MSDPVAARRDLALRTAPAAVSKMIYDKAGLVRDPDNLLVSSATSPEGFVYLERLMESIASLAKRDSAIRKGSQVQARRDPEAQLPYPTTFTFMTSAVPGRVFELDIDKERIIRRVVEREPTEHDGDGPGHLEPTDGIRDAEVAQVSGGPTLGTEEHEALRQRSISHLLGRAASQLAQAAELTAQANEDVLKARERGATWSQIGDALGVRPQAAHQRFAPGAKERHADRQRTRREK